MSFPATTGRRHCCPVDLALAVQIVAMRCQGYEPFRVVPVCRVERPAVGVECVAVCVAVWCLLMPIMQTNPLIPIMVKAKCANDLAPDAEQTGLPLESA